MLRMVVLSGGEHNRFSCGMRCDYREALAGFFLGDLRYRQSRYECDLCQVFNCRLQLEITTHTSSNYDSCQDPVTYISWNKPINKIYPL